LTYARAAVKNEPEYLVARDLLWRIEALQAQRLGTADEFLKRLDQELATDPQDRLAMSAAAIHQMLGDTAGASALETIYKEQIQRTRSGEAARWTDITGTRSIESKIQKLHTWLAEDPITSYASMAFQLLAPSYLMTGNYRSTALYGLLSLRVTPSDAMTLNGVALAMAEGQFQLERGLRLADQAYSVLSSSGKLRKPEGMSDTQWKVILEDAQASTLDTKAWLLTRLKRWDEAEKAYNDALRIVEKDEFYLHYGIMLLEQGNKERALEKLKRGLRISGPKRHEIRELITTLEQ
jgi:tetratricopeptide (TPR) repeat protein